METLTKEEKRQLILIAGLPQNEAFTIWRDTVCSPILNQLKAKLRKPSELSDIELRASVMHLNSMENLFEDVFNEARFLTKE